MAIQTRSVGIKAVDSPFLRWAGGKSWLLNILHRFIPKSFNNYHEPFLGAGSVFFHLQPKYKSFLSDSNQDLINCHCQIRDNLDPVVRILLTFENNEDTYYRVRNKVYHSPTEKAAQFLYLNRTCFNGLYRVNHQGKFNVPFGFKNYKVLFDIGKLQRFSDQLEHAILWCGDFETSLQNIEEGDLVFLDPPYTVTHVKNGFVKYNEKLFSWQDQIRLYSFIENLRVRGAYYILTNAKHESIRELFGKTDHPFSVSRASVIGGKGAVRGMTEEYIFTNVCQSEEYYDD